LERAHTYRKVCRTVARKNIFEAREKMGCEAFFGLDVDQRTNKNPPKNLIFRCQDQHQNARGSPLPERWRLKKRLRFRLWGRGAPRQTGEPEMDRDRDTLTDAEIDQIIADLRADTKARRLKNPMVRQPGPSKPKIEEYEAALRAKHAARRSEKS
jgi:hypothetical protein